MKKNMFLFVVLVVFINLIGCAPNKVDIKMLSDNQIIPQVPNRIGLHFGDTCILKYSWTHYNADDYCIEYSIITKEEMEKCIKARNDLRQLEGAMPGYEKDGAIFGKGIILK
jgi:hypothetical protein